LDEINKKDDILFIIVTGDITENGLQKEFELFHRIMASSRKPYLTVIGNHDYLSNGALVYQKMYGPVNYSFTFQNVKFVMWDNVLWESNKRPDWDWFETELAESPADGTNNARPYTHVIPFSHIPPTDGQMELDRKLLHELLQQHRINLSIHGHKHEYSLTDVYEDGIQYLTVGSPQKRVYAELTITPDAVKVERIDY
jgi:3',5'-cyclic-AMP phosphodiesterase